MIKESKRGKFPIYPQQKVITKEQKNSREYSDINLNETFTFEKDESPNLRLSSFVKEEVEMKNLNNSIECVQEKMSIKLQNFMNSLIYMKSNEIQQSLINLNEKSLFPQPPSQNQICDIRFIISDLISNVTRNIIVEQANCRKISPLLQNQCFELFIKEGILDLWNLWFLGESDFVISCAIISNYGLLIQNIKETKYQLYLIQHQIMHDIIIQKNQNTSFQIKEKKIQNNQKDQLEIRQSFLRVQKEQASDDLFSFKQKEEQKKQLRSKSQNKTNKFQQFFKLKFQKKKVFEEIDSQIINIEDILLQKSKDPPEDNKIDFQNFLQYQDQLISFIKNICLNLTKQNIFFFFQIKNENPQKILEIFPLLHSCIYLYFDDRIQDNQHSVTSLRQAILQIFSLFQEENDNQITDIINAEDFEFRNLQKHFQILLKQNPLINFFGNISLKVRNLVQQLDNIVQNPQLYENLLEQLNFQIENLRDEYDFISDLLMVCSIQHSQILQNSFLNFFYCPQILQSLQSMQSKSKQNGNQIDLLTSLYVIFLSQISFQRKNKNSSELLKTMNYLCTCSDNLKDYKEDNEIIEKYFKDGKQKLNLQNQNQSQNLSLYMLCNSNLEDLNDENYQQIDYNLLLSKIQLIDKNYNFQINDLQKFYKHNIDQNQDQIKDNLILQFQQQLKRSYFEKPGKFDDLNGKNEENEMKRIIIFLENLLKTKDKSLFLLTSEIISHIIINDKIDTNEIFKDIISNCLSFIETSMELQLAEYEKQEQQIFDSDFMATQNAVKLIHILFTVQYHISIDQFKLQTANIVNSCKSRIQLEVENLENQFTFLQNNQQDRGDYQICQIIDKHSFNMFQIYQQFQEAYSKSSNLRGLDADNYQDQQKNICKFLINSKFLTQYLGFDKDNSYAQNRIDNQQFDIKLYIQINHLFLCNNLKSIFNNKNGQIHLKSQYLLKINDHIDYYTFNSSFRQYLQDRKVQNQKIIQSKPQKIIYQNMREKKQKEKLLIFPNEIQLVLVQVLQNQGSDYDEDVYQVKFVVEFQNIIGVFQIDNQNLNTYKNAQLFKNSVYSKFVRDTQNLEYVEFGVQIDYFQDFNQSENKDYGFYGSALIGFQEAQQVHIFINHLKSKIKKQVADRFIILKQIIQD